MCARLETAKGPGTRPLTCTLKNFEEDSYVQILAPNGDYRYGFILATEEAGQHLMVCLHEEADSKLAYESSNQRRNGYAPLGSQYGLSDQELRVLALFSKELNTAQIAKSLNRAPSTVRFHLRTLRLKLRVENPKQLLMVARAMLKLLQAEAEEK